MCHLVKSLFLIVLQGLESVLAFSDRPTVHGLIAPALSLTHAYLHKNELGAHAPDDLVASLRCTAMK